MPLRYLTLPLLLIAATALAEDWPQWRGPDRNGLAPGGPPLADKWPASGPVKVWQTDYGFVLRGLGCVSVAGGNVLVYGNVQTQEPVETRTLFEKALRDLGWLPAADYPPDALYQMIETARLSPERANLAPTEVSKWVADWLVANIKDEESRKKFGNYAIVSLRRGAAGLGRPMLDKLAAVKGKTFANQAELDKWFTGNGFDADARAKIQPLVTATQTLVTDVTLCLDASTGRQKWRTDAPGKPGGADFENSATPCVAGGRCYVLGSTGFLYCLNVQDGGIVWKGKIPSGATNSSSVVVAEGKAIITVAGAMLAFKTDTGDLAWQQHGGYSAASPVLWTSGGKTFVIGGSGKQLSCVDVADGALLWKTAPGGNNSTPVIAGDCAVVQGEGSGLTMFRLSRAKPAPAWNIPHDDRGSSPLIYNGYVYVVSGGGQKGKAMCLKLESGQVMWEEHKGFLAEICSPVIADGKIIAFDFGRLCLIRATPDNYGLLAQAKMGFVGCTSPAVADGRLYVRLKQGVACYDLRAQPPQAP
jgi:outer membrane protein assembly factor BamB